MRQRRWGRGGAWSAGPAGLRELAGGGDDDAGGAGFDVVEDEVAATGEGEVAGSGRPARRRAGGDGGDFRGGEVEDGDA